MYEPSTRLAKALFGVGLTVVSQQVTVIDKGILSQLNTELNLGRRLARRYALYLLGAAIDETRLGEQVQKLISNNPRGQANARQRE